MTDKEREELENNGFIIRGEHRFEMFEGKLRQVVDGRRSGWWRFNSHYDRQGYCDNPARGY
jgi:hypothetical protein